MDVEMPDRGCTVRSFLESQVVGKAAVIDRTVEILEAQGYEFLGELKELTYEEVIGLKVPAFAAKKLEPQLKLPVPQVAHGIGGGGSGRGGSGEPVEVTADTIRARPQSFCGKVRESLQAVPKQEFYETKLPSSIGPVCMVSGATCLLWHGVGEGLVPIHSSMKTKVAKETVVLLAPSGSGKTRQLIEMASGSDYWCLFFTGKRQQCAGGGSDDILFAYHALLQLYPTGNVSPLAIACIARVLLVSRLTILGLLCELHPTLSKKEWTFFQLEYPALQDVFAMLTKDLLEGIERGNLTLFLTTFTQLLQEKAAGLDFSVVLDEAQIVDKYFQGRVMSSSHDKSGVVVMRSMLNTLVGELYTSFSRGLFVSGTGAGMLAIREGLESGSMKMYPVRDIYRLPGFATEEHVQEYLNSFIDVGKVDIGTLSFWFKARCRWLVTAVERFMQATHDPGTETKWFEDFAWKLCSKPGTDRDLLVAHSVFDSVGKFWNEHPGLRQFVCDILYGRYTMGVRMPVVVPPSETAMALLEYGLGVVYEKGGGHLPAPPKFEVPEPQSTRKFTSAYFQAGMKAVTVELGEELVYMALMQVIPDTFSAAHFARSACDASAPGTVYERFSLQTIAQAFNRNSPAEVLDYNDCPQVYKEKYVFDNFEMAFLCGGADLVRLVDDIKSGRKCASIWHTGTTSNLGSDGMIWARNVQDPSKLMFFIIQHQTGKNVGFSVAYGTTDFFNIMLQTEQEQAAVQQLQDWCASGFVQMLVLTPLHTSESKGKDKEGNMIMQKETRRTTMQRTQPLRALFNGKTGVAFLSTGVTSVIEQAKGEALSKKSKVLALPQACVP